MSGDRVNPSGGDIRTPSTLLIRERQIDGSIGRISAWQRRAETGDEDAGRGGGDAAASWFGMGNPADRGGDRLRPRDGAAVSGRGWLDTMPGSDPAKFVGGSHRLVE